jgi:hypothetical protein
MNFQNISKEHKQYIVLGGIVVVTSLFAVINFVLMPMKAKWSNARAEFETLRSSVDDAHRMVKNERKIQVNLEKSDEVLQRAAGEFLPDIENPLSWATQKMYAQSRVVGVEIASVSEVGGSVLLQTQAKDEHRAFGSYAVRVIMECSFERLKALVQAMEESNPYLSITGLTVDSRPNTPNAHSVNLVIEWPICLNTAALEKLAEKKG